MTGLAKLVGPDLDSSREFVYPDVWEREQFADWSRLRIGLREGEIELILDLCCQLPGPFGVLYVLVISRLGRAAGRYQSPEPLELHELELFLRRYRDFIEQDGRHHLWVSDISDEGQFIFDRHNFIYAYGPLPRYEERLRDRGIVEGAVRIPSPHAHEYHPEFDRAEGELLAHWEWRYSPLRDGDDV